MRVFWHNGALMIEPEGEREIRLLSELVGNLNFGKPQGMQNRIPAGDSVSGSEGLFESVVGDHQTVQAASPVSPTTSSMSFPSINCLRWSLTSFALLVVL